MTGCPEFLRNTKMWQGFDSSGDWQGVDTIKDGGLQDSFKI